MNLWSSNIATLPESLGRFMCKASGLAHEANQVIPDYLLIRPTKGSAATAAEVTVATVRPNQVGEIGKRAYGGGGMLVVIWVELAARHGA